MSNSCAGLPTSFDRFHHTWHVDFEFRLDGNHLPVPVCMFAREQRTGAEIFMRRDQLLTCTRAPFDCGADSLIVAYAAIAELSCFHVLGWSPPRYVLCAFTETIASINGRDDIVGLEQDRRPSLLQACELYGVTHVDKAYKDRMRALVLNNTSYTEEQWREIEAYNRSDVDETIGLLNVLAPQIDLPAALFRGRYLKAATTMEVTGIPIDTNTLAMLVDNWQRLRLHYIRRNDTFGLYDTDGRFNEARFANLVASRGWPLTETGKPVLRRDVFGKQCRRYPELKPLQHLRDVIAELRLGAFVDTVGADGYSRISIKPFWTRSGRNQPSERDKAFLLGLPAWTHGLIKPPPGWGMALLDWQAQELGLAAALSGDPALVTDFRTGDPHIQFAIRAGLAPEWATKATHRITRELAKPICLGANYGLSKYGVAAKTGKSLLWAADMLAAHRHLYHVFSAWQANTVAQAQFDGRIDSPLGWPMAVHAGTKRNTLLNYPEQAAGADLMRLAAIAAAEAGIRICAPVHDAFWIMAPLSELGDVITAMSRLMVRAANAVTGGLDIPVEVAARVEWPHSLGDVRKPDARGQPMWLEIMNLLHGDLQEAQHA